MTSFLADISIWILLVAGTGFGLLGFVGLLIFPDIRSRMFTATRATLISASLITLSVIIFGINGFLGSNGNLYGILIIHTLFLFGILIVADIIISRILLEKIPATAGLSDNTGTPATPPQE